MLKNRVLYLAWLSLLISSLCSVQGAKENNLSFDENSKLLSPLSGDYLVGLNSFNMISGKNLKYEKSSREIFKDVELSFLPKLQKSEEKYFYRTSEYFEPLYSAPHNTTKEWVSEEYYELKENGKVYEGSLSSGYPNEVFATLTEAISNLNSRGVSGNVRFLLTDTLYTEAGTMTINISGSDTTNSTRTLTIKPNVGVASVRITTNSNSPVFIINQSYVIFDGSNSIGGTTRNMKIENTGNSSTSGNAFVSNVKNVSFKNLICYTKSSATSYNFAFDNVNYGTVENCELKRAAVSVQSQSNCNNFSAINNDIGSQITTDKIQNLGIAIISTANFNIQSNRINGIERPYSNGVGTFGSAVGIQVGDQSGGINSINGLIQQNLIQNIKHTGIDEYAYSALGIRLTSLSTNSNITVVNNIISDILGDGDEGVFFNPHGIFIDQGGGYNIYHNSINLFGTVNNYGLFGPAYTGAITIYPGTIKPSSLDIRNNIFTNSQTIAYTGSKAYAIYCGVTNTAFINIDYNNYYSSGSNAKLGFLDVDRSNITDWRAATGKDISSKSQLINYISNSDLHLTGGSIGDANLIVPQITGITNDIDNETRPPSYQYLGADENTAAPLSLKLNLKVLIEGFFENGGSQDTITVLLAKTSPPYINSSGFKALSSADGNDFYFPKEIGVTSYYIVVLHRNSIETWSASPVTFSFPSATVSYDFTNAQNKAYGNNQVLKSGKWCIFGGDVNQDGIINSTDLSLINTNASTYTPGYLVTDITGDNFVDIQDQVICENNYFKGVVRITP